MAHDPKKKKAPRSDLQHSGAEAAVGMDAIAGQRGAEPTRSKPGAVKAPAKKTAADRMKHPGSEPLEGRTTEHESGYGGKGASPRVSSEKRERVDDDGSVREER
jgi:hypothetical protein